MSVLITCGFCGGDGCSACDPLAEPACECGAPTARECECEPIEAGADDERPDYAPDRFGRW